MVKSARILPFRGLCYNPEKVDYKDVVAPPYDVISGRQENTLNSKSPYNIVRLILSKDQGSMDRYTHAQSLLDQWIKEKILIFDPQPAIYFYLQDYTLEDGTQLTRKGFIALCKLEEYSSGKISPHERTHQKQIDDRLKLLRACKANLSPILSLYTDPDLTINETFLEKHHEEPLLDVVDNDEVRHRFYRVTDPEALDLAIQVLSEKKLLIADGHHRYATALAYKKEMEQKFGASDHAPFNYIMMYFTNTEDRGLTILPSHRLIHSLEGFELEPFLLKVRESFDIMEFPFETEAEETLQKERFFKALNSMQGKYIAFGLYIHKRHCFCLLSLKEEVKKDPVFQSMPRSIRHMAIPIFNELILKRLLKLDTDQKRQAHINIIKNNQKAVDLIHTGRFQMAFLFNPNTLNEIHDVISENQVMPQKSTFFYPKLLTGLVIYKHNIP
ncbi:MAG: hypothetical protein DSY91_07335 [Deltaproteobacteria bacterium]|nr:MAG: hypothetical protein DSY91_07335 [Deltaproteobacteria bacterium]